MHPHPPSPSPRKLLKLKSPFLFIYYFIFGKSQIGWLLIRLHLFHITIYVWPKSFLNTSLSTAASFLNVFFLVNNFCSQLLMWNLCWSVLFWRHIFHYNSWTGSIKASLLFTCIAVYFFFFFFFFFLRIPLYRVDLYYSYCSLVLLTRLRCHTHI